MSKRRDAETSDKRVIRKIKAMIASTKFSEEPLVLGAALMITLVLILYAFGTFKTEGEVWRSTFGGPGFDVGNSIIETKNGGLVVAGRTNSWGAGGYDCWLISMDSKGRERWNQTYGGPGNDEAMAVLETSDGGLIFAGGTDSQGMGNFDAWLMKTDSLGEEIWNRTFGGSGYDWAYSLQKTKDGGYIILGETESFGSGGKDAWLIRTDGEGDELWNRTYGGANDDGGRSAKGTEDGGFIITGFTESFGAGGSDLWLLKTDSEGAEVWNVTYGGSRDDVGEAVGQTPGGGYVVAGGASAPLDGKASAGDAWLIITDPDGKAIRGKIFSVGDLGKDIATAVQATADGGYIIGGWSSAGGLYSWLLKTDGSGTKEWDITFGGSGREEGSSVLVAEDGGYVTCGWTISSGNTDLLVVKINK
jgi:predicted secreted protein